MLCTKAPTCCTSVEHLQTDGNAIADETIRTGTITGAVIVTLKYSITVLLVQTTKLIARLEIN